MRKCWIMMLLMMFALWGCESRETMETVTDTLLQPAMAEPRQISVQLPEEAVAPVLSGTSGQVYLCDGYEILVETREGGDLPGTVRDVSGFEQEKLTVLQTRQEGADRYEFVWAAAGEAGDRLGRAVVLDDGNYHYCLSVLRDASLTERSQILWDEVFRSFGLV